MQGSDGEKLQSHVHLCKEKAGGDHKQRLYIYNVVVTKKTKKKAWPHVMLY